MSVIVDIHTHIFPPEVASNRESYLAADATFHELYDDPKARIASAEDLLTSMDVAGVEVSVALGFAWTDEATVRLHNDYLLEVAASSGGRIVPFCTLPLASTDDAIEREMRRCVALGARGFGELRPDNLRFDIAGERGARLAALAREVDVTLLFHASEPVGHTYPGKEGGSIGPLYTLLNANPGTKVILAHLGGGLPFYAHTPEVRRAVAGVGFDTAACGYLYEALAYAAVEPSCLLFGSDFPLVTQGRARRELEAALPPEQHAGALGDNAARWLGLKT
jgi:predicted TIM-barrel fold metal-dependent hydrolase